MIFKLPGLRELSVIFERDTPSPLAVLPNLTKMYIECDHNSDRIQVFHGTAFERLETVMFNYPGSEQIGDFLETFERATLATSIQNTLSEFYLFTWCSWNPNYSSLLPFTELTTLVVEFSCGADCSSRVDDEIIMNLAWAMPKLEILQLGDQPCSEIPIGVTVKGLVVLADNCPDLDDLQIHFQVINLSAPPAIVRATPTTGSIALRRVCGLRFLDVGYIPMPEESVSMVALTLARIFPSLEGFNSVDENWEKVIGMIRLSGRTANFSGKGHHLSTPKSDLSDTHPGATLEDGS